MHRLTLFAASALAVGAGQAVAGEQLPGTLNFSDVTVGRIAQTTVEQTNNEKAVDVGDFDEDGDLDVVIATAYGDFGARRNKLYRNDDGVFQEVTDSGLIPGFGINKVSRVAFLRDFDMDGHLDIYVINDSNSHTDQIFIAQWVDGQLDQFVEEDFRIPGGAITGAACSGVSEDFDEDDDFDVYCGNYPNNSQDRLLQNDGTGFFNDVTGTNVPPDFNYVVDVATADMNGDGNLDILVSNHFDVNWIYYNDNLGAGSGLGDFRYTGSTQNLGQATIAENSMEPADFDGDGDQDVYWGNRFAAGGDRILRNDGNDGSNKATFTMLAGLPPSVSTITSRKIMVADLNDDGRVDAFVMKEQGTSSRPTVLRNTSVGGNMSFVDWTSARAFPSGNLHMGWHAAIFDTNGDGDLDILLGGWSNEHLFEQTPSAEYDEGKLTGGVIPNVFDLPPAAVLGSAGLGESDTYVVEDLGTGAFVSVVLNGPDDYLLEILDDGGGLLQSVDRGGAGIEEAVQIDPPGDPTTIQIRVTVQACANPQDLDGDCLVGVTDLIVLLAAWGPNPGHPADFDGDDVVGVTDLITLLAAWGGESQYILEVLSRAG